MLCWRAACSRLARFAEHSKSLGKAELVVMVCLHCQKDIHHNHCERSPGLNVQSSAQELKKVTHSDQELQWIKNASVQSNNNLECRLPARDWISTVQGIRSHADRTDLASGNLQPMTLPLLDAALG